MLCSSASSKLDAINARCLSCTAEDSSESDSPFVPPNKRRRFSNAKGSVPVTLEDDDQPAPSNDRHAQGAHASSSTVGHRRKQIRAAAADVNQRTARHRQDSPIPLDAAATGTASETEDLAQASIQKHSFGSAEGNAQRPPDNVQQAKELSTATADSCDDVVQAGRKRHHVSSATADASLKSGKLQQTDHGAVVTDSSGSDDVPHASRNKRRLSSAKAEASQRLDDAPEDAEPMDAATQLVEEGLDPLPDEATGHRSSRRASTSRPGKVDIRAKMQQKQKELLQVRSLW